jgi:hypothetical protein
MRRTTRADEEAQERLALRRASMLREIARLDGAAAAITDPAERIRLKARAEAYRCALHEDSP